MRGLEVMIRVNPSLRTAEYVTLPFSDSPPQHEACPGNFGPPRFLAGGESLGVQHFVASEAL